MVDETVKVGSDRDEYISTPFYSPLPLLPTLSSFLI